MARDEWLAVDRKGLGQLLTRRSRAYLLLELLQNSWDEEVTRVNLTVKAAGRGLADVSIEDDSPTGFQFLEHAYTLFAPSVKKGEVGKRGRFNLGEKLILAACREAKVISTTGTIIFHANGQREESRERRKRGSLFQGVMELARTEIDEAGELMKRILPPPGVRTYYNGTRLTSAAPLKEFSWTLSTEIVDERGFLKPSRRKCQVRVYKAKLNSGTLYEMGIPVVDLDDKFDVDVLQKIPLGLERDSVRPAFLRELRLGVVEATKELLTGEDFSQSWALDAMGSEEASEELIRMAVRARFGDKVVSHDPGDPEATKRAVAKDYTVVYGRSLPAAVWDSVRRFQAIPPASDATLFKTPRPEYGTGPDTTVPREKWTEEMTEAARVVEGLGKALLGFQVKVRFERERWQFRAHYGARVLSFNLNRLPKGFFNQGVSEELVSLTLHELAHEKVADHLSSDFNDAVGDLGGKLAVMALNGEIKIGELRGTALSAGMEL